MRTSINRLTLVSLRLVSLITVIAGLLGSPAILAGDRLTVFACEPEWAALADEIGGAQVKTFSATHARQDPHYIRARPSLIAKIRRADLVICSGAGLEVGWLPVLLQKANAQVQPGATGSLMAAELVPVLEVPVIVDRSQGDVHPEGNPHVHLDPYNILKVAEVLARRLETLDPANAAVYGSRLADFTQRWQAHIAQWETRAAPLRGKRVVVHHKAWSYLIAWLGLEEIATLEPRPGIPPTPSHLETLLLTVREQAPLAIIRTPYRSAEPSEWLAEKTGIPAVMLPYTVGGDAESGDLFALFERTLALLEAQL